MKLLVFLMLALPFNVQLYAQGGLANSSYDYKNFDKVYLDGVPGTVTIEVGKSWSVRVDGDKESTNLLQLSYQPEEYTLMIRYISNRESWRMAEGKNISIRITMPEASVIRHSGNCSLSVSGISGRYIRLESSSNGNTVAIGTVDKLDIIHNGNGDINATAIIAGEADVKNSGNGDVSLHATAGITGKCSGNGDIVNNGKALFSGESSRSGNGRLIVK